jgi:hypothetical protein
VPLAGPLEERVQALKDTERYMMAVNGKVIFVFCACAVFVVRVVSCVSCVSCVLCD